MTIYYFSSTGNCLEVAKKLGGTLISIPYAMRQNQCECTDDMIGLVFPVYGLMVPPIIHEFIKKAKLRAEYMFAVITYGTYDAGSVNQFCEAGKAVDMKFDYVNTLHMQENYLPGFAMEKQKTPANQEEKMNQILEDVKTRKQWFKKNSGLDRFMTWTHKKNYHYTRGIGVTKQYSITKDCTGCGICQRICPTQNITIIDGKPVFLEDCLSCLACTQNCPNNAIRLNSEKSQIRYRNPNVTLADLLKGNV